MSKLILSTITGIVLGIIGARFLFVGSALSLVPWGIVGLILGWWSKNAKEALTNGVFYGFFLAFSFMAGVYHGNAPIVTRIPFFSILGLVGAACGLILTQLGYLIKRLGFKKSV